MNRTPGILSRLIDLAAIAVILGIFAVGLYHHFFKQPAGDMDAAQVILHHVADSPYGFMGLSKHVFMMWIAAAIVILLTVPAAAQPGLVPRGVRNFLEVFVVAIRDDLVRPLIGHHGDRYLPILLTFFFFIFVCNFLGLVPGGATATGNIGVTATLALIAFTYYHLQGIREQGLFPYLKNIVPPGLPSWLVPLMIVVEIVGHLVKPFALCVRLFANMTGGHIVLLAFFCFTFIFKSVFVAPVSIVGTTCLYFLELFVALVQAYVFTFLMTVFLGMSVHPEH